MAESNVIKEFLVALGYKTDETAMKKFTSGIELVTKGVMVLGLEVEATAIAVAYGVQRWAANLEQLYWASQRTGVSASNLRAYALASTNMGSSMESAMSSAEGFAAYLQSNPAHESFVVGQLHAAGVAIDNLSDRFQTLRAISEFFTTLGAHGQTYRAIMFAQQWGFDRNQMLAMMRPGYLAELAKEQKNVGNIDAVAKGSMLFERTWRDTMQRLESVMSPLLGKLMTGEGNLLGKFAKLMSAHGPQIVRAISGIANGIMNSLGNLLDWLDEHGDEISDRFDQISAKFGKMYDALKPAIVFIYDLFVRLDHVTGGWSTNILAVVAALKLLGAGGLVSGLASIAGSLVAGIFRGGLMNLMAASAGDGALAKLAGGLGYSFAIAAGVALGYYIDELFPNNPLAKGGRHLGSFLSDQIDQYRARRDFERGLAPSTVDSAYYSMSKDGKLHWNERDLKKDIVNNFNTDVTVNAGGVSDPNELAAIIINRQKAHHQSMVREYAASAQ